MINFIFTINCPSPLFWTGWWSFPKPIHFSSSWSLWSISIAQVGIHPHYLATSPSVSLSSSDYPFGTAFWDRWPSLACTNGFLSLPQLTLLGPVLCWPSFMEPLSHGAVHTWSLLSVVISPIAGLLLLAIGITFLYRNGNDFLATFSLFSLHKILSHQIASLFILDIYKRKRPDSLCSLSFLSYRCWYRWFFLFCSLLDNQRWRLRP